MMIEYTASVHRYILVLCVFLSLLMSASIQASDDDTESIITETVKNLEKIKKKKDIEEAEQLSKRPDSWRGPTKIYFAAFILDIDGISDANQNFDINIYTQLRWHDRRLANTSGASRQIALVEVWNPRVLIANQQGQLNEALPKIVQVEPDGTVIYRQRYTGKLSQPLNLSHFPLDKHLFEVQFAAAGYQDDQLEFIPDTIRGMTGGSISDKLSLPDWTVTNFAAKPQSYHPIKEISTAGFAATFEAKRLFSYYIWQIILPFSVIIIMSWAAFWVDKEQLGIRVGISTSSVLTLIAHRFVLANLLPKLPYMTRLDYFSVFSTFLVLFALVMFIFVTIFMNQKNSNTSNKIDLISKILFPVAYLVGLVLFLMK